MRDWKFVIKNNYKDEEKKITMGNKDELLYNALIKIVNELQNQTARQQAVIDKLGDVNNMLFRQYEILKKIQEQTKTQEYKEQEEIKKKIEEINKLMSN